jgi:hypothetical protein
MGLFAWVIDTKFPAGVEEQRGSILRGDAMTPSWATYQVTLGQGVRLSCFGQAMKP